MRGFYVFVLVLVVGCSNERSSNDEPRANQFPELPRVELGPVELPPVPGNGHRLLINSVAFSPDGKMLATGSSDQTIKLWNVKNGHLLATLIGHDGFVNSVAFSPDGKTLASASYDHTVKLWDVQSKKALATLQGHKLTVDTVDFSPDGKTLASAGEDNWITLWDVDSRRVRRRLNGHNDIRCIAFSPDGKLLASAGVGVGVKLWDVLSGELLKTILEPKAWCHAVAFSMDSKFLAVGALSGELFGDSSGDLFFVDLRTGKSTAKLGAHTDEINSVRYSPDGKLFATASDDETVRLWNVQTYKPIATLKGHSYTVNSVAFSPDGKTLASVSGVVIGLKTVAGEKKLWDLETMKEIKLWKAPNLPR